MSLTSYRAAPPRVNSWPFRTALASRGTGPPSGRPRKGGTYNRFEEDVKREIKPLAGPRSPLYGGAAGVCEPYLYSL
jgi:hypothetical protein